MYKAIIFDLGQVVVKFDLMIALNRLLQATSASRSQIITFFKSEDERLFTEGKLSGADFFVSAKQSLSLDLNRSEFEDIYNGIFIRDKAVEDIINQLKAYYRLAILSNTNEFHFSHISKNFNILKQFDDFILSFEQKCQKPDRQIFINALEIMGVKTEETIFIDDTLENVEASRELGITSILHENADSLKHELLKLGVFLDGGS